MIEWKGAALGSVSRIRSANVLHSMRRFSLKPGFWCDAFIEDLRADRTDSAFALSGQDLLRQRCS